MNQEYNVLKEQYDKNLLNYVIIADNMLGGKSNFVEKVKDQMNHIDEMLIGYLKQIGINKKKFKEKMLKSSRQLFP